MKNEAKIYASLLLLGLAGCHTSRVGTATPGPRYSDRQFFAVAGLIDLSNPAGEECRGRGMSYVESEQSVTDFLISVGISAVGAGIGAALCRPGADLRDEELASCVASFASAAPVLLSSRTVEYQCTEGPQSGAGYSLTGVKHDDSSTSLEATQQLVDGLTPARLARP